MSNSVLPHRRKPTRLPHPWDSPGKNTGVGFHFLLQCMKVKSEREVTQSCPTRSDPMDCSPPGSSVHGIFQARVLEWGAIAFSDINKLPRTTTLIESCDFLKQLFYWDLVHFVQKRYSFYYWYGFLSVLFKYQYYYYWYEILVTTYISHY